MSARDIEKLFLLVEDELRNNQHDTENQKALHFILSSIETAYTKATQQEVEETLLLAMVG
ncbi:MAG: hypothetical protein LBP53_00040 [Candidatus Peribacteria bacterium]|nr:hypothetical protein [Candidatus Peribacteria bacterium]